MAPEVQKVNSWKYPSKNWRFSFQKVSLPITICDKNSLDTVVGEETVKKDKLRKNNSGLNSAAQHDNTNRLAGLGAGVDPKVEYIVALAISRTLRDDENTTSRRIHEIYTHRDFEIVMRFANGAIQVLKAT